ncbi:MAG: outer membrane beta-barrel protein [Terracidiphilus sp.]
MRSTACFAPVLAALFLAAAIPAHSQVAPAAKSSTSRLSAGGGISYFLLDYGLSRKMIGITAWGDYRLPHMPYYLDGLSIEAEGRDINFDHPSSLPRMRQDTLLGGPLYTWSRYRRFHPYAKYLLGIGSIDFPPAGNYDHDTRVVLAPGVGVDYRLNPYLIARVDYEYQFWHAIFGPHDLNPQGVTFGVLYTFGRRGRY